MDENRAAVLSRALNRRTLLAGSVAAALLGTASTRAEAKTQSVTAPPTVSSLTSTTPYYVAHRGGGRNWPEMTAFAYAQAVKVPGITALEVSVCITSDGVLVCSHDQTTTRTTGVPYAIINETWDTLSTLKVLPYATTDPSQRARAFTRFDDIVEMYMNDYVLFVEPKSTAAIQPLMARMAGLGQPERVVWKQPLNSRRFAEAKDNGFATWGYALDVAATNGDDLTRYAASPDVDLVGAPDAESNAFVSTVVAAANRNGKQTIAWEIGSVAERTRVLNLGCVGLMTSNVIDVVGTPL